MVNRSARISGVADGGQISASQEVFDIIERVVMDHKPPPSSLDSDSSGDEDEEEEALSPTEKQDVLALRRLGFGVSELGVRQLMGSETAEMVHSLFVLAVQIRADSLDPLSSPYFGRPRSRTESKRRATRAKPGSSARSRLSMTTSFASWETSADVSNWSPPTSRTPRHRPRTDRPLHCLRVAGSTCVRLG